MEVNTILWIGGIAVVAILGAYTIKASKRTKEDDHRPTSPVRGQIGGNVPTSKPQPHQNSVKSISPDTQKTQKPLNLMAAKKAFLSNVIRFIPKLNSLCDGTYKSSDWTDDIIDINDEDLIGYWKKIHKDSKAILRVFSGWGLKPEMCSSFVSLEAHKELYTKADGTPIEVGKNYNVVKQCWILTEVNSDGKTVKRVLIKGEVV